MDPELFAALEKLGTSYDTASKNINRRMDEIEIAMQRPRLPGEVSGDAADAKLRRDAFACYVKRGREGLTPEFMNALVVSDDTRGGFLAPAEFIAEMLKNLVLYSPIRLLARVRATGSGEIKIPKRSGTLTGRWVGETETRTETSPTYGLESIPIHEAGFFVDVSSWQLEDSVLDMAAELASDAAEEAGRLEGAAFVNGNGVKMPEGFMQHAGVAYTPTGSASLLNADSLVDALYALPPFYRRRATWVMNGTTLATVRKLKDGNGQYLWQPSIAAGQPETLLSRPCVECIDMDNITANAFPIAVADFESGYRIFDRMVLGVLRDPFRLADVGQVRFYFRRRVGGAVVKAEAFRKVKIATS